MSKRNSVRERKRSLNAANIKTTNESREKEYKKQKKAEDERLAEMSAKPYFYKNRKNHILKGNYLVVFLMIVLIIINTIGRGFVGTFWYIIPNIIFIISYIYISKFFNPINFASDNRNFLIPKVNYFYLSLRKTAQNVLQFLGKHLERGSIGSLKITFILSVIGSLSGFLFYGSSFAILGIAPLIVFVVRTFAGNYFREDLKTLNLYKWILFAIFAVNSIVSIIWKTPIDFQLFILISLMNSICVFYKNTYIYTVSEVSS